MDKLILYHDNVTVLLFGSSDILALTSILSIINEIIFILLVMTWNIILMLLI